MLKAKNDLAAQQPNLGHLAGRQYKHERSCENVNKGKSVIIRGASGILAVQRHTIVKCRGRRLLGGNKYNANTDIGARSQNCIYAL